MNILFQLGRKYDGDIRFRVAEGDLLHTNPVYIQKRSYTLMELLRNMEPFEMPKPVNPVLKAVWDNIFQISAGLLVLILLVIGRNSIDNNVKTGIIVMTFVYVIIRFSVAYQSHQFEQKIDEKKKRRQNEEKYDDLLKKR